VNERHATLTVWENRFDWSPADAVTYADIHVEGSPPRTYDARVWESPVVESAFPARELIPSWNGVTPGGTWLLVEGRVADAGGWTPWFTFARWAEDDPLGESPITRTTVPGQQLEAGEVHTDTYLAAAGRHFDRWQLRLTGLALADPEPVAGSGWPTVSLVAGVASWFDIPDDAPMSPPSVGRGHEIALPRHSQRLHLGTFPEWDNGGESWCSPTSTTMVLEHWGVGPSRLESAWVGHHTDPSVVHGVRRVFDRAYQGAGNWAFNTAYAGSRGLRAYVTRLRDLTEAECFIAAGIPLVVSVSFTADELDGAGYDTKGHLLTIAGFTDDGDVVSNDPNSHLVASNDEVRALYRRDQFERVWLGSSGGLAYVMHPPAAELPAPPTEANWL
jgi:hypothetical protein